MYIYILPNGNITQDHAEGADCNIYLYVNGNYADLRTGHRPNAKQWDSINLLSTEHTFVIPEESAMYTGDIITVDQAGISFWLSPQGIMYHVSDCDHYACADYLGFYDCGVMEHAGWIHCSGSYFYNVKEKLVKQCQIDVIREWCKLNSTTVPEWALYDLEVAEYEPKSSRFITMLDPKIRRAMYKNTGD